MHLLPHAITRKNIKRQAQKGSGHYQRPGKFVGSACRLARGTVRWIIVGKCDTQSKLLFKLKWRKRLDAAVARREFGARSVGGHRRPMTAGCAIAAKSGTRSIREASVRAVCISGQKRSASCAIERHRTPIGTKSRLSTAACYPSASESNSGRAASCAASCARDG